MFYASILIFYVKISGLEYLSLCSTCKESCCGKGSAQYVHIHHCKEHGVIVYNRIQFNGNPEQGKPMCKYWLDRGNDLSPVPLSIFTPIFHASNFLSLIFYFSCTVPPKPNKHHLNSNWYNFPKSDIRTKFSVKSLGILNHCLNFPPNHCIYFCQKALLDKYLPKKMNFF